MLSIGLMSGTSMDGIDAALLETDGKAAIQELGHTSINYHPSFKILLKAAEYAVHQCNGDLNKAKNYYSNAIEDYLKNILKVTEHNLDKKIKELAEYIHGNNNSQIITFAEVINHSTFLHGQIVAKLLKETAVNAETIDVVGYHGQTLFHRPLAKITIQVGDGQALANQVGITVVTDFRSRDVAMGGQGAPFAPLYHQALAIRDNKTPLAVVNCGGIANVTFIAGIMEKDVMGFDTGPGNGLIDRFIQQQTQGKESMDENGHYGNAGEVNNSFLRLLYEKTITKDNFNFFTKSPPKSLDINDLQLIPELQSLSIENSCATLEAFTADTIVNSLNFINTQFKTWILAGGGWNNPVILRELTQRLLKKMGSDIQIKTADEFGWNSKAMEAQIFAWLAVRSLKNLPISTPNTTGITAPLSGGQAFISENKKPTPVVAKLLKENPAVLNGYKIIATHQE